MTTDWNALYARRLDWMTTSAIREILKVAQAPDVISMAGGWPEADPGVRLGPGRGASTRRAPRA